MNHPGMHREETSKTVVYRWHVFEAWEEKMSAVLTTRIVKEDPLLSGSFKHPDAVQRERVKGFIATAIGAPHAPWALCRQVHGVGVAPASPAFSPCADALFLDTAGIIAAVFLADCLPITLYDPVRHVGMVCHAGWRGTAAGMACGAVKHLVRGGSRAENLVAAAGPGIGPCCYRVGKDVAYRFNANSTPSVLIPDGSGYRLNLEEANLIQLRSAGIAGSRLGRGGFCTACRVKEFFSHRKEGDNSGRHAALMFLSPKHSPE